MRSSRCWIVIAAALAATAGVSLSADDGAGEQEFQPKAYHPLFSAEQAKAPHVRARSFDLRFWPFLDGQWEGIVTDDDGYVWFAFSSHSGTQHGQVFRYNVVKDIVEHVADLGQACGEKLTGNPPQDKIHSQMFADGNAILAGTCEGHVINGNPYKGGYWLSIDRHSGVVTDLGKSVTNDGLLCVGYDAKRKLLYGLTNRTGELTVFDPATRKEKVLGVPWQDWIDAWKADTDPKKPKEIWPRSLTLMITADGKVYGAKPPGCTFWCYDPATGKIGNIPVDMPLPVDVAAGDAAALKKWKPSSLHLTIWDEKDQCFYVMRSYDETLCRFSPPAGGKNARLEPVQAMGLKEHRYNQRYPSCTLVMLGRTIYYTPYTGWGGTANLQSYDLETKTFKDYGPIVVEGGRMVNECHSLTAGKDGKLYLAAFVFSKQGTRDPVTPWAMRAEFPFHSRLVIIDPQKDCLAGQ